MRSSKNNQKNQILDNLNDYCVISVNNYRHIRVQFQSNDNTELTVKLLAHMCSQVNEDIDYTIPPSRTNDYAPQEMVSLNDSTDQIIGTDGIEIKDEFCRQYRANLDGVDELCFILSDYVQGDVQIKISCFE